MLKFTSSSCCFLRIDNVEREPEREKQTKLYRGKTASEKYSVWRSGYRRVVDNTVRLLSVVKEIKTEIEATSAQAVRPMHTFRIPSRVFSTFLHPSCIPKQNISTSHLISVASRQFRNRSLPCEGIMYCVFTVHIKCRS
jgi:hypothetical protein